MNIDLPKHAADKVKRALDDVHQIADTPGEMLRIALMGAGICIGQAAGILHSMIERDGRKVSELQVKDEVIKLLRVMSLEGADAAWKTINQSPQERADG